LADLFHDTDAVVCWFGWLTYLSPPPLANYLSAYNLGAALLAEGLVRLWLLVMGVNVQRWKEQASAAGERRSWRAMQGRLGD
jgi:hypothetical protein